MGIKMTNLLKNISNNHKIYVQFPFLGHPKFTQIRIFGLKIYHLAILVPASKVLPEKRL
jgi:hypothetical protein